MGMVSKESLLNRAGDPKWRAAVVACGANARGDDIADNNLLQNFHVGLGRVFVQQRLRFEPAPETDGREPKIESHKQAELEGTTVAPAVSLLELGYRAYGYPCRRRVVFHSAEPS